jgi:hypothetical protein
MGLSQVTSNPGSCQPDPPRGPQEQGNDGDEEQMLGSAVEIN